MNLNVFVLLFVSSLAVSVQLSSVIVEKNISHQRLENDLQKIQGGLKNFKIIFSIKIHQIFLYQGHVRKKRSISNFLNKIKHFMFGNKKGPKRPHQASIHQLRYPKHQKGTAMKFFPGGFNIIGGQRPSKLTESGPQVPHPSSLSGYRLETEQSIPMNKPNTLRSMAPPELSNIVFKMLPAPNLVTEAPTAFNKSRILNDGKIKNPFLSSNFKKVHSTSPSSEDFIVEDLKEKVKKGMEAAKNTSIPKVYPFEPLFPGYEDVEYDQANYQYDDTDVKLPSYNINQPMSDQRPGKSKPSEMLEIEIQLDVKQKNVGPKRNKVVKKVVQKILPSKKVKLSENKNKGSGRHLEEYLSVPLLIEETRDSIRSITS